MLRNEGMLDRFIRGVLGVLIVLSGAGLPSGSLWVELAGVALFVTALIGWCPIYQVLHLDTRGLKRHG